MNENQRIEQRQSIAKQVLPLLEQFAETYRDDPKRPNFLGSPLDRALVLVFLVIRGYAKGLGEK